ncbi:MAG: hypothetical protein KY428_04220, partial [Bacteroidetes bacterium]|nr:hypothetical protein [Bacteroidota bacterium]
DASGNFQTITGQTGATLSDQPAGRYRVVATRNDLLCDSDPVTVVIDNTPPAQTLTLTPTAQTTCSGTPNGQIEATYGISPASTGTYQLEWFLGTSATTGTPITTNINGDIAEQLYGNQYYTVRATDGASGCQTIASVYLPIEDGVVTFTTSTVGNSICDPSYNAYNGSITVGNLEFNGTAVTDYSGYTFAWEQEDASGNFQTITGQTGATLSDQPAGRYRVVATRNDLLCDSDPVTVVIDNTPPAQTLTLTPTAQTTCSGTPNGQIEATYGISPASTGTYQLEWFLGTSATTGTPITTNINGDIAEQLYGNQYYTVRATDGASGCQTIASVYLPIEDGVVTFTTSTVGNSICDPSYNAYNGSITVGNLEFNGTAVTDYSGYTFAWEQEDASGNFQTITGQTGATLSDQPAGRYRVVATRNDLLCDSDPVTVTLYDDLPVLSLDLTPLDQTSCNGTPNGEITASLSIDGITQNTGDYALEWFSGSSTAGTPLPAANINGDQALDLAGDQFYTIRATDQTSGCQTVASVYVPAQDGIITFTYDVDPNTVCDPNRAGAGVTYDGNIAVTDVFFNGVSQLADLSIYQFTWYQQISGTYTEVVSASGSGSAFTALSNQPPGNYQLVISRSDLGCVSNLATINISNETDLPVATLSATPQVACSAPYTGSVSASISLGGVAESLADYRFEWFQGTGTSGTPITANLSGTNNSEANQLASGYYTLRATRLSTGCRTTASVYVEEQLIIPITELAVQNIMSCNPADKGYLTASVYENGVEITDYSQYTFTWYKGRTTAGTLMTDPDRLLDQDDDGSDLPTGYYTVVATKSDTRCSAAPQTQYLAPPPPLFTMDTFKNRLPTTCNEDAGVVTAWVDEGGGIRNVDDYTFEWYAGRPTDPRATFYSDPAVQFSGAALDPIPANYDFTDLNNLGQQEGVDYYKNGASLFGVTAGIYTVVVTRKGDNCREMLQVELPFDNGHKALQIDITHSEICPTGVGSVRVQATDEFDVPFPDQTAYIFYLFQGNNPGDINDAYASKQGTSGSTEFDNLSTGYYTFMAQETLSPDQCSSISQSFEIKQVAVPPLANTGTIIPSSMCVGGNGSAEIIVGPDEYEPGAVDPVTTQFSISLSGPTTPSPVTNVPAGTYPFPNLEAGSYTATVQGYDTNGNYVGCATDITFIVPSQPPVIQVQATPTHQTYCTPVNGEITVMSVSGGATTDLADYTFSWLDEDGNPVLDENGLARAGANITDLAAGTYYVIATQNINTGAGSGCSSAPMEILIEDNSVLPTLALSSTPNEACDNNYTGTITVTPTIPTATYTWSWSMIGDASFSRMGNETTSPDLIGLDKGVYELTLTAANGCPVTAQVAVGEVLQMPVITATAATDQTNCLAIGDGTASVTGISYAGVAESLSDYIYSWTDASGNTVGGNTATINNLTAGTYYVSVTKNNGNPGSGCPSAPVEV